MQNQWIWKANCTQVCHCSLKAAMDNTYKWTWLCPNKIVYRHRQGAEFDQHLGAFHPLSSQVESYTLKWGGILVMTPSFLKAGEWHPEMSNEPPRHWAPKAAQMETRSRGPLLRSSGDDAPEVGKEGSSAMKWSVLAFLHLINVYWGWSLPFLRKCFRCKRIWKYGLL